MNFLKAILLFFVAIKSFAFSDFNGSIVLYDTNTSNWSIENKEDANTRFSPCSTFKILNSAISLEVGAVKDVNETIKWDGQTREYEAWNSDQNMQSAIRYSTVWFYKELAVRVGEQKMYAGVHAAHYGNMDTSKTLTDFWLGGGSLKISPKEQVEFLYKFFTYNLPFNSANVDIIKNMILQVNEPNYSVLGKTGSCDNNGWFVGVLEKPHGDVYFAFHENNSSGTRVKEFALEYLKK